MSALIQAVKENVGQIVKTIALVILILCILGSISGAIILFSNANEMDSSAYGSLGILVLFFGPVTSFVPFAFAYAFGELVENSTIIAKRGGTGRPGVVNNPNPQNSGYTNDTAPSDDTYIAGGFQYKIEDGYAVITGVIGNPQGVVSVPTALVGSDVTAIGNFAFSKCTDIKRVEIPNSVKSIGWSAFSDCTGLYGVSIPESVESIGSEIFSGCANLNLVWVREGSYAQKWCTDNGFSDKVVTY